MPETPFNLPDKKIVDESSKISETESQKYLDLEVVSPLEMSQGEEKDFKVFKSLVNGLRAYKLWADRFVKEPLSGRPLDALGRVDTEDYDEMLKLHEQMYLLHRVRNLGQSDEDTAFRKMMASSGDDGEDIESTLEDKLSTQIDVSAEKILGESRANLPENIETKEITFDNPDILEINLNKFETINHDLRNRFGNVKTAVQMAQRSKEVDTYQSRILDIDKNMVTLRNYIDHAFLFLLSEYPKQKLSIGDLNSYVQKWGREELKSKGLTLTVDPLSPKLTEAGVIWSVDWFETLLDNITQNLVKSYRAVESEEMEGKWPLKDKIEGFLNSSKLFRKRGNGSVLQMPGMARPKLVNVSFDISQDGGKVIIKFKNNGLKFPKQIIKARGFPKGFTQWGLGKTEDDRGVGMSSHQKTIEEEYGGEMIPSNPKGGGAMLSIILPIGFMRSDELKA